MDSVLWQDYLQPYGIRVKKLTPIREWSESRVIRVDGMLGGRPVIHYLKRLLRGGGSEKAIYRFAAGNAGFPAP